MAAIGTALALLLAACGDDDDEGDAGASATTAAEAEAPATTGADGGEEPTAGGEGACSGEIDEAVDEELGTGAGQLAAIMTCAAEQPLEAEGEPVKIGFLNHEGDPRGNFPEYRGGMEAAVDYINNELGGIGGDVFAGTPGRPIEVVAQAAPINPAEVVAAANKIAAEDPLFVFVALNFFGDAAYNVFRQAGIPIFVGTPITVADFTGEGLYSIGASGGCVGVHTGLVEYTVNTLEARRVMVVWSNTPPGVVCYHDLEKKPLNVLNGTTPPGAGSEVEVVDGLEHGEVSFPPATADLTAIATQALDYNPDAIIFSGQSTDCWNLVSALTGVGFDPQETPLVLSGACNDSAKIEEAGDTAVGIHFVGSGNLSQPDNYENEVLQMQAQTYLDKLEEYSPDTQTAGFTGQGFQGMMLLWDLLNEHATEAGGFDSVTGESYFEYVGATSNHHHFAAVPMGCADAVEPYVATCATRVSAVQWDGEGFSLQQDNFSGTYIVEGTPIDTGA